MKLGVNIDHVAVLREARKINDPDPFDCVGILRRLDIEQVTIHLREDRRHISDIDATKIVQNSYLPVNLECSINKDIVDIVCDLKPHRVTLVPENRDEVTTEGGLDVIQNFSRVKEAVHRLKNEGIDVSLFVDPNLDSVEGCKKLDANTIELHTGEFSNVYAMLYLGLNHSNHSIKELYFGKKELQDMLNNCLKEIEDASILAHNLGLKVCAGHGLNYKNVSLIKNIKHIEELNIGQSIVARSIFTGFEKAVQDMIDALR